MPSLFLVNTVMNLRVP